MTDRLQYRGSFPFKEGSIKSEMQKKEQKKSKKKQAYACLLIEPQLLTSFLFSIDYHLINPVINFIAMPS
jgi:hypothetical protein